MKTIIAGAALLLLATSVNAAVILDQQATDSNLAGNTILDSGQPLAQSFTVGVAGVLDSVKLALSRDGVEEGTFTLSLKSGADPSSGSLLFSETYSVLYVTNVSPYNDPVPYDFIYFDTSLAGIQVQVGEQFVMVIETSVSGANTMKWQDGDAYDGGSSWAYSDQYGWRRPNDSQPNRYYGFQTYVEASVIPIPAAAWLFGSALAGLFGVGRMRRQAA